MDRKDFLTRNKRLIHSVSSVFSFCILISPEIPAKILIYLLLGCIVSFFVFWKYVKWEYGHYIHKNLLFLDVAITIVVCNDFYNRWIPSSKIAAISNWCHLQNVTFLVLVSIILGSLAISFIDAVLCMGKNYCHKVLEKNF